MTLEVCIDCIESALAAKSGGADRIEVCGALAVDGITPSFGLVEQCVELGGVEVAVMIRPHVGGFCYGENEVDTMLRDVGVAKQLGANGVVLGALGRDGRIDRELCQRFIEASRPQSVTFHRAFDLTPDAFEALDSLLELGVDRLLTSGQAATAKDGAPLIHELVRRAGKRLSVMAGAGIRVENVVPVMRATGVREIHTSASELITADRPNAVSIVRTMPVTNHALVRAMVQAMQEHQS
jgi:copper homeostasis protein